MHPPFSQETFRTWLAMQTPQHQKLYQELLPQLPKEFATKFTDLADILLHIPLLPLHHDFSLITRTSHAIALCIQEKDIDLKVLKPWTLHRIHSYKTYLCQAPSCLNHPDKQLLISRLHFQPHDSIPKEFTELEKLSLQDEGIHHQVISDPKHPSIATVHIAWNHAPKHRLCYHLARILSRNNLLLQEFDLYEKDPYSLQSLSFISLKITAQDQHPLKEDKALQESLQEAFMLGTFHDDDTIDTVLTANLLLSGNEANLLRFMISLIHQTLVHADPYLYSLQNIAEAFCRHPDLTSALLHLFKDKFHPTHKNHVEFPTKRNHWISQVHDLDTGYEINDTRRKNIFYQAINFIDHCLKTNYYDPKKQALAVRLDPQYLAHLPYQRQEKFPEIPYGIFYIQGPGFMGFHIRFKDLSRGGLRSLLPKTEEQLWIERNQLFAECYNLAYTQQKKNKDIPEGGSKAVILINYFETLSQESSLYAHEKAPCSPQQIESFVLQKRTACLYNAQKCYIKHLLDLINCDQKGHLVTPCIIDNYKRPEYIYLGPDENMHNDMLDWIANYSQARGYPLSKTFISSKPSCGINHKEYGVTSLGVNTCMEEMLLYLDIDPQNDSFTIKMTGGPDGDVAGNQILNLHRYFPKSAKLITLIDGSGLIYDPKGLDLAFLASLFEKGQPIALYPSNSLSSGGFLLSTAKRKDYSSSDHKTLCMKNHQGTVKEEWLSSNETHHLLRHFVHQTTADIFIPAGGRPRTLNNSNYRDFLDTEGKPTAKAIIEGANLYLTQEARLELEKLGVLIVKDSSANKGGVICSSLEVLSGLVMSEQDFLTNKSALMQDILQFIKQKARNEIQLLLKTHAETDEFLTVLSEKLSEKINHLTYELLDFLTLRPLPQDVKDPLIQCLINYCPPFLRGHYLKQILTKIPEPHQKAIIACYIASKLIYRKGIYWTPSIVDILPTIAQDMELMNPDIEE